MGVRFDRLRYEVFQNLFLSPMNTGSVRPAVATTPTACGIETNPTGLKYIFDIQLQQHLPPAVLKPCVQNKIIEKFVIVATTPTACGIETISMCALLYIANTVATTPTACGIETSLRASQTIAFMYCCNNTYRLRY